MNLFENTYDGELSFDIENFTIETDEIIMDLFAEFEGKRVGLQVTFPIQTKRVMFKSMVMPDQTRPMFFASLGESSDQFIAALDKIWSPDFEVSGKFEENAVEIEYAILNRELFDCTKDKTYTRVYAQIDMETGDEYDNINLELGFNFNLERKRASIVEIKRQTRNDFLALIMR